MIYKIDLKNTSNNIKMNKTFELRISIKKRIRYRKRDGVYVFLVWIIQVIERKKFHVKLKFRCTNFIFGGGFRFWYFLIHVKVDTFRCERTSSERDKRNG